MLQAGDVSDAQHLHPRRRDRCVGIALDRDIRQVAFAVEDATAAVVDETSGTLRHVTRARHEVLRRRDDAGRPGIHAEPARFGTAKLQPDLGHMLGRDRSVGERDLEGSQSLVLLPRNLSMSCNLSAVEKGEARAENGNRRAQRSEARHSGH